MIYYDKNNKKIRQGDVLYYDFGNGNMNVVPVSRKDGELGIDDGKEFVPLSGTALEYAYLKRPRKNKK